MSWKRFVCVPGLLAVLASAGCVTGNSAFCDQETPCLEEEYPFCDLTGEYGARNGCVEQPAGTDGDDDGTGELGDGPVIEVLATQVRDERDDIVSFASGGAPRAFEHVGQAVELGGEGCPVVYKHAFLLRPDHGAEESPANPLELRFRVMADPEVGVDPDGGAYRLRAQGSSEYLTDWLAVAGASGEAGALVFTAGLDRAAVPELATLAGPLEVELRGRDRSGREVSALRCVDVRPLAGPLEVGEAEGMPRFSLLYRDPVSTMLNGQGAWPLMQVEVRNGTPDPVFATFDRSAVVGTCLKRWQKWNVLGSVSTGAGSQSCEENPTLCMGPVLDSVVDHDDPVACSPALSSSVFDLRVEVNGAAVEQCGGCAADQVRLPPGSAAVVSLVAVDLPGLQPRENSEPEGTYSEQEVMYRTATTAGSCPGASDCATMEITGSVAARSGCTRFGEINGETYCTERRTYKMVRALTTVSAAFEDLSIDVASVSVKGGGEQNAPTGYGAPRVLRGYLWSTSAGSNVPDA